MKIAIIGAGNMGGAIAAGLAKGKLVQSADIICTARTQTTLVRQRTGIPGQDPGQLLPALQGGPFQ